jgi:phospholipid/cholesterol/gamma-HCH transport system substrate-binding protein
LKVIDGRGEILSEYVKHLRWAKLKVGIVITIALVIVFFALMFAGNIERIFAPKVLIYAVFDDVKGLRDGSPVWFSGVEIGSVQSISFTTEETILVEMLITAETVHLLKEDSEADILTLGLLGDKYIEITPGSRKAVPLEAEDTITGTSHVEIQEVVETGKKSIEGFNEFIDTLEGILVKVEKGEGTVARFLDDPSIYNNLKEASHELSELLIKVKDSKGTMNRLLTEDELYRDIDSSSKSIKSFSKRLETSEGTLNKFINDESLYENTLEVTERLNGLLDRVDRGEGFVGSLMKDEELAVELKNTLAEFRSLIKDLKENPHKYFKFSVF